MWKRGDIPTDKLLTMNIGTMKTRIGSFFKIRKKERYIFYISITKSTTSTQSVDVVD